MKIQVLGTGCMKCNRVYAEAEKAIAEAGVPVQLEKVERLEEIMKFGVAVTPAVVVDGEIKSAGKIPKASQIVAWLQDAARASADQ